MNNKQPETINQFSMEVKQQLFDSIESGTLLPKELRHVAEDKWALLMIRLYTGNMSLYRYLKVNILSNQEESNFFSAYEAVKDNNMQKINVDEIILEEQETIESYLLRKSLNRLFYMYPAGIENTLELATAVATAIKYISTENLETMDIDLTNNVNMANVGRLLIEAESETLNRIRGRRPYLTFVDAYADYGNIQEIYNFVISIPINKEYKGEAELAEMAINIMNGNPIKIPDAVVPRIPIEELRKIKKLVKLEYQYNSKWREAEVDRAYSVLDTLIRLFTASVEDFPGEMQDTVLKIQKYTRLIKTKVQNGLVPAEVEKNGGYYEVYQLLKSLIRDFLVETDIKMIDGVMMF